MRVRGHNVDTERAARERRYEAAFADGQAMLARVAELERSVEALEVEQGDLAQLATRRAEVEGELSVLYDDVFEGPTPGHPDEDEAESALVALGMQVEQVSPAAPRGGTRRAHSHQLESDVMRDRAVVKLYAELIATTEHAERQFRKAQKAASDQNGMSSRSHYKYTSKRLYANARNVETKILDLHPAIVEFPESLPRGDSPRKHHCRRMATYFRTCRDKVAGVLGEIEADLEATEAQQMQAKEDLRELRCMILEDAFAPPTYQGECALDGCTLHVH